MQDVEAAREAVLRAKRDSDAQMRAIKEAKHLDENLFCARLRKFVLAKYHLTDVELPSDDFDEITELSLSESMRVSPELVKEFDLAQDCEGASSAMTKKVLLLMAIEKNLDVKLDTRRTAYIKTLQDLCELAWDALEESPTWEGRLVA